VQKARSWNNNKRNGGVNSRVALGAELVGGMIGGFAMFAAAV
jgi:hypothetical protein